MKSLCRCNRRPVYTAYLHNQIQTLFSTISLPSLLLFFSKGQNPSGRQHLCFATCECVVHPFHFPVHLQDSEPANSLCYRFHSIYFCRVFKTSHTENHLLTNHFSITLLDGCVKCFVASSQLQICQEKIVKLIETVDEPINMV